MFIDGESLTEKTEPPTLGRIQLVDEKLLTYPARTRILSMNLDEMQLKDIKYIIDSL